MGTVQIQNCEYIVMGTVQIQNCEYIVMGTVQVQNCECIVMGTVQVQNCEYIVLGTVQVIYTILNVIKHQSVKSIFRYLNVRLEIYYFSAKWIKTFCHILYLGMLGLHWTGASGRAV
jgi:hypothetical protein